MDERERPARAWQWQGTRRQTQAGGRGDEQRATCLAGARRVPLNNYKLRRNYKLRLSLSGKNPLSTAISPWGQPYSGLIVAL